MAECYIGYLYIHSPLGHVLPFDEGFDAFGEFAGNEAGLVALGMAVEVKPADAWEDLTGEERVGHSIQ